ncbi:MAG TPA: hypothetical protein PLS58_04605 [Bacteroidales bacterium]|nr:hypothetical protein [Bacteroidales bacterium]
MNVHKGGNHKMAVVPLIAGFLFFAVSELTAQEKPCIVKHPALSEKYSGDCKNGLANGKGAAQGIDKYHGQFRNGLPHGKGTYIWADGTHYTGQFKNGLKDGKGTLVTKDSTVTGYWQEDRYIGKRIVAPYQITRSISITRTTFKKIPGTGNYVRIKFIRGGSENIDILDFSLAHDSGEQYRLGQSYGIQNALFPLSVIIRFKAWNFFHTAQYEANLEFVINEPATWEVTVNY